MVDSVDFGRPQPHDFRERSLEQVPHLADVYGNVHHKVSRITNTLHDVLAASTKSEHHIYTLKNDKRELSNECQIYKST